MTKAKRKSMDTIAQLPLPQEPNWLPLIAELKAAGVTGSLLSRAAGKSAGSLRLYELRAQAGKKTHLDWMTGQLILTLHEVYCQNPVIDMGEAAQPDQPVQQSLPFEGTVVPQVQAGA